jgi:Na+(H+)/acetate symporter ActP
LEERLIIDFGHNLLHQCLLGMILYCISNVKDFNILTFIIIIIIIMLMMHVTFLPKKLTEQAAQTYEMSEDGQELRPKHVGAIINPLNLLVT